MKKFLALVLALVMTMSLVTVSASAKTDFTDDAKITNEEAVEVLNAMGVLTGYADGTFRPQGILTRGAGAKIIAYLVLGQKAADKLTATYSIFKDVTDSVGLAAYIEWAYAAGIVDGYGDGNFGPYNTLTEFAFGKMLLTALGYVSSEEGYVGAGWQKNVYADALAAGVYDGTETAGACTRDAAARMALGALTAEVVVYGKKTNLWVSSNWSDFDNTSDMLNTVQKFLNKIGVITTEGAIATGAYLWQNYAGLYYTADANDVFDRPGHAWTYKTSFDKFYMDAPVKEYTTKVAACDVLVDLGIAKTSKSSIDVDYDSQNGCENDGFNLNHKNCDDGAFGGVGSLTQVFELADGDYVITTIDTYLAKVEAVKAAKHGLIGDEAKLTVHTKGYGSADAIECREKTVYVEDITGLSKGDYLLVNVAVEDAGYPCDVYSIYNGQECMGAYLAIVGEPTTVEGKLTKLTKDEAMKLTVGGKEYAAAYEYAHSANKLSTDKTSYIWFLDQYGNIIADMLPAAAAPQYGRIDALDWINDTWKSEFAQANLVTAADTTVTESVVDLDAWNKNDDGTWKAMKQTTGIGTPSANTVSDVAKENADYYAAKNNYGVVSYVVDADGDYYVQNAGELLKHPTTDKKNDMSVTKGQSKLGTGLDSNKTILADDDTQYLVYLGTAGYKAYKGFNNIPSMSNVENIVAVATTAQGGAYAYAEFVYIHAPEAIFAGETVEAYVIDNFAVAEDEDHYFYNVWVDGKETTIVADKKTDLFDRGDGIYHISFNADAEALKSTCCVSMSGSAGVESVAAWALIQVDDAGHYYNYHVNQEGGNNAVNDLNFKSAKVYLVGAGEITEFDYKDLVAGTKFVVKFAAGTYGTTNVVDTIYVYELPEGTWGYKPLEGDWA